MAQNLSVESFKLLPYDMAANTQGTKRIDQNGEVAALIRVVTTEEGFTFDGGMMGIVDTKPDVGEILVYVPHGINKITIKHNKLGILRDYAFPIPIEAARTYELKLTSGTVRTIVEQVQTSQFVVFMVQPTNAVVFIDDEEAPHVLDAEGKLSILLKKGIHSYRITAPSYISESGAIELTSEKITKEITLKSAKATLTVNVGSDAEIWINEIKYGNGNWTGELGAGMYMLEARKASHRTVIQEILLSQQEKKTITLPTPEPIYGTLMINSTPLEADVLVDGRPCGETPLLIEQILVGNHSLEVLKDGWDTYKGDFVIIENETTNETITLNEKN